MSYGQGGQRREQAKFIKVGAYWSGTTKDGVWKASGGLDKDLPDWKLALLCAGFPIHIFSVTEKSNDRAPDFNMVLSVPESQLPDEYWDELEEKARARESRGGGYGSDRNGYTRQAPPAPTRHPEPARNRGGYSDRGGSYPPRQEYRQQARPAQRPAPRQYDDEEEDNFREEAPRQTRGRYAEDSPTPHRGRGRQVPQSDDDLDDPFADG